MEMLPAIVRAEAVLKLNEIRAHLIIEPKFGIDKTGAVTVDLHIRAADREGLDFILIEFYGQSRETWKDPALAFLDLETHFDEATSMSYPLLFSGSTLVFTHQYVDDKVME